MSYRVLLYSNWEDDNDVFLTFRRTIELPFPPFAGLTLWFRVAGRDDDSSVEIKDVNWSMYEREFQCNLRAVQKIWFRDMTPKEMIKAVREEEHDLGFKEISVEVIGPTKRSTHTEIILLRFTREVAGSVTLNGPPDESHSTGRSTSRSAR